MEQTIFMVAAVNYALRRRVNWEILDAWRDAAEECGINKITEFNRGDNTGCAYFQMNQKRGRRWSATKAYLQPIRSRKNLTILTKTLVHRVNLERKNSSLLAQSVTTSSFDNATKTTKIYARKEVILAAGAIGSPQILQLSGIGNPKNLAEVGIELK